MKLVQINICDNGSTGKIMSDIFNNIDKNIQKVGFVGFKYTENPLFKRIHSITAYRIHKLLARYFAVDELGSVFETIKLIRQLKKIDPDIIHLHNIHSYTLNYNLLFRYIKKYNKKTVWTLHDCWAFTGGCYYFDDKGCYDWQEGCENCKFLKSAGVQVPINSIGRYYKEKKKAFSGVANMRIVTPSKWLKDLVCQSFLKAYDTTVINNGINLDNFIYTDNHTFDDVIDRNKKIILGVASPFNERKGFSDFIKLANMLDETYQIVMVGVSDEQFKVLSDKIIGIKRTESQIQLAELYSISYAFVNLTYEDNFPTVNIEALACGTPVVCYQTGGATEMFDESNGIVVKKGDLKGVVQALNKVEQIKKSNNFSDEIRQKYSAKRMADDYLTIYNELMGK